MNDHQLLQEADRCVKCGLCLPHCPTYRLTRDEGDSPRGRIALIQASLTGQLTVESSNRHLDRCLGCRACEAACPSGVKYGSLLDNVRDRYPGSQALSLRLLLRITPNNRPLHWLQRLLGIYQGLRLDRLIRPLARPRLGRLTKLLPALHSTPPWQQFYPAQGDTRGRVGLFTGCIGRITDRPALEAAIRVLTHQGLEVVLPAEQTCCGALHQHNGEIATAAALANDNRRAFGKQSLDALLFLASGCGAQLVDQRHIDSEPPWPILDLCQYLAQLGWRQNTEFKPSNQRVVLHSPCSLRYPLRAESAAQELLRRIPGLQLHSLQESGCCGAAGSYLLNQPNLADDLRSTSLEAIEAESPDILLTSNTGCALHLAAGLGDRGMTTAVMHPIELIWRQLQPGN